MGEIVMEVVERVIGREVDAEAHRDLIDEAVAALRADTTGGAAAGRGGRGAPVNPTLQGYTAAVTEVAGSAALGRHRGRPRSDRAARHVQHPVAGRAERHRRPGTGTPGRDAGPARGQGGARGAAAWPPSPSGAVPRPGDGGGPGLAGHPGAPPVRGRWTRSRRSACWRPASGWRASPRRSTRTCPPSSSSRSRTSSSGSPASSRPRPALRGALTDRDLAVEARHGRGDRAALGQGARPPRWRWSATPSWAAGPATSWARSTGWSSRPRRPGAGASPGCGPRPRSTRRSATELAESLAALAGGPVELQVEVDESLLSGASSASATCRWTPRRGAGSTPCASTSCPAGWEPSGFGRAARATREEGAN